MRGVSAASVSPLNTGGKNPEVFSRSKGDRRSALGAHEAVANRVAHETRDLVDVEALHQLCAVGLHGLDTEIELPRDLLRRRSLGDELQHLALARRQHLERRRFLLADAPEV